MKYANARNQLRIHESAAAIAIDGKVLFAIAEERLSRKKHDGGFPVHAISAALAHANAKVTDLDEVAFGWHSFFAIQGADLRNYLTGADPMPLGDILRAQSVIMMAGWIPFRSQSIGVRNLG